MNLARQFNKIRGIRAIVLLHPTFFEKPGIDVTTHPWILPFIRTGHWKYFLAAKSYRMSGHASVKTRPGAQAPRHHTSGDRIKHISVFLCVFVALWLNLNAHGQMKLIMTE